MEIKGKLKPMQVSVCIKYVKIAREAFIIDHSVVQVDIRSDNTFKGNALLTENEVILVSHTFLYFTLIGYLVKQSKNSEVKSYGVYRKYY